MGTLDFTTRNVRWYGEPITVRLLPFGTRYKVIETNSSWCKRLEAYYAERLDFWRNYPHPCDVQEQAHRDILREFFFVPLPKSRRLAGPWCTGHIRDEDSVVWTI